MYRKHLCKLGSDASANRAVRSLAAKAASEEVRPKHLSQRARMASRSRLLLCHLSEKQEKHC